MGPGNWVLGSWELVSGKWVLVKLVILYALGKYPAFTLSGYLPPLNTVVWLNVQCFFGCKYVSRKFQNVVLTLKSRLTKAGAAYGFLKF